MVRAVEGETPFFYVTTITAPPGLLSDEETDVVVDMASGMKATRAHHAAIIQCTVPIGFSVTLG